MRSSRDALLLPIEGTYEKIGQASAVSIPIDGILSSGKAVILLCFALDCAGLLAIRFVGDQTLGNSD